jgi:hypothetical protein
VANSRCGHIGFTKDPDLNKATVRMEATLEAVRQFLTQHPDVFLVGPETEATVIFFGPRELIGLIPPHAEAVNG